MSTEKTDIELPSTIETIAKEIESESDPNDKAQPFEDSTTGYLYNGGSCLQRVTAYTVLIFEIGCYILLIEAALGDADDQYKTTVKAWEYNDDLYGSDGAYHKCSEVTPGFDVRELYCRNGIPDTSYMTIAVATSIVLIYLSSDVLSVILNFRKNICASVIILVEVIVAIICAGLTAMYTGNEGGVIEIVTIPIGVLFIHEMDEQLFKTVSLINSKYKRCGGCCCNINGLCQFICVMVLIIVVFVLAGAIKVIAEAL
eukprot:114023_1